MPVPSAITDLSTTAGSNSPAGTDPIGTDADNYIRAHAAFIAQLRDGSKNLEAGTATAPSLAFTGDTNTGIYSSAADVVTIASGGGVSASFGTNSIAYRSSSTSLLHSYQIAASIKGYVGTDNGAIISGGTGSGFGIRSEAELILMANATDTFRIDTSGRLKNTGRTQTSFRVSGNAAVQSGTQFLFDTEQHDQGSCFGSNAFTAPVTGVYVLSATVSVTNLTGSTQTVLASIRGSTVDYISSVTLYIPSTSCQGSMSSVVYLTAGATATVNSNSSFSGTLYAASGNYNTFSGYLLG